MILVARTHNSDDNSRWDKRATLARTFSASLGRSSPRTLSGTKQRRPLFAAFRAGFSTSEPGAATPSPDPRTRPASRTNRLLGQLLPPLPIVLCHLRRRHTDETTCANHRRPLLPAAHPRHLSAATCYCRQLLAEGRPMPPTLAAMHCQRRHSWLFEWPGRVKIEVVCAFIN